MDSISINAAEIDMFSDTSGNHSLGFGAYCGTEWTFGQWDRTFCDRYNPSIEYLELFGVLVAVLNWIRLFKIRRVVLFCDNESVVSMINNSASKCKNCMMLIRLVIVESLVQNVRIFAKHVSTKDNGKADALSRLDFGRFWKLAAGDKMNEEPTKIPDAVWPL